MIWNYYSIILWFILVMIIHELGHYIAFMFYGIRPQIKIKWWGINIGKDTDIFRLTPLQYYIIAISGILSGLTYTMIVADDLFIWIYLLMCAVDFHIIMICISYKLRNDKTLSVYSFDAMEKVKQEYMNEKTCLPPVSYKNR